jgi:hypothetical protein
MCWDKLLSLYTKGPDATMQVIRYNRGKEEIHVVLNVPENETAWHYILEFNNTHSFNSSRI